MKDNQVLDLQLPPVNSTVDLGPEEGGDDYSLFRLNGPVHERDQYEDSAMDAFSSAFASANDELPVFSEDLDSSEPAGVADMSLDTDAGALPEDEWIDATEQGAAVGDELEQPASDSAGSESNALQNAATLGAGGALLYMGYKGLSGLKGMVGTGGKSIANAVTDFRLNHNEQRLRSTVDEASDALSSLRQAGLSKLDNSNLTEAKRQKVLDSFMASTENRSELEQFVKKIDRMGKLSSSVAKQGIAAGLDEDTVSRRATEPMQKFMEENKTLLDSIKHGGESLFERMSSSLSKVFDVIRMMLDRLVSKFSGGEPSASQSSPRMG